MHEYRLTVEAHIKRTEMSEREQWERMRTLATISIQPHVKNRITPERLLPLPWDHKQQPVKKMTKEEARATFERLKADLT